MRRRKMFDQRPAVDLPGASVFHKYRFHLSELGLGRLEPSL